jgi:hypothetical protein
MGGEGGHGPAHEPCVRCGKPADHDTETCCSSHEKRLCHACYRRTHFVEVCRCSRPACVAEQAAS